MRETIFEPDRNFFSYISKPGRYVGGELGAVTPRSDATVRLLLVYPAEYEAAVDDLDYHRLYIMLNEIPGVAAERATLFAPDAFEFLKKSSALPFSLETRRPWSDFDYLVFLVGDPLNAARIPRMLRDLRELTTSVPPVAIISLGRVIPRFLSDVSQLLIGDVSYTGLLVKMAETMGFAPEGLPSGYFARGETPQIIPAVGTPHDELKIPLFAGPLSSPAEYAPRSAKSVARDTLCGLAQTGLEGVRLVAPVGRLYPHLAEVFSLLSIRANLAHQHFVVPALTAEQYLESMAQFRPHFLKSELPLLYPGGERIEDVERHPLAQAGQQALSAGWKVIVLAYRFNDWEQYRTGLSSLVAMADFLLSKCKSHEDKRAVRVRWEPAPGDQWKGSLEYDDRIQDALSYIHQGALQRLPQDQFGSGFDPSSEVARQLLLCVGPECLPILEELPLRFPEHRSTAQPAVLGPLRELAGQHEIRLPEFAQPIDLSLSPFLTADRIEPHPGDSCTGEPEDLPMVDNVFGRRKRRAAFTRRLTRMSLQRLRLHYAKGLELRFFSHLDMVRMIERAIRRSRLPISYSEGFHPRPKISFGPPLPLGAISRAEYVDLVLNRDFEPHFVDSLKKQFPPGLQLVGSQALPAQVMSLFERINLLSYRVALPSTPVDWNERIDTFMTATSVLIDRVSESETKERDIRPHVNRLGLLQEDDTTFLEMELLIGARGTVRPAEVIAYLGGDENLDPRDLIFERTEMCIQDGPRRISPMDFK